jgi:lipid-A-disaccharide synthase-like uncharacterized protein
MIFKIIGALGLILITIGVLTKKEKLQNIYFIIGGLLLETYSIYLKDPIFITLQIVFVLAATYELIKLQFFK